jgi:hypothetical protein
LPIERAYDDALHHQRASLRQVDEFSQKRLGCITLTKQDTAVRGCVTHDQLAGSPLESSGRSRSTSDRWSRPLIVSCCVLVLTALVAVCLVAQLERDRLQRKRILVSGYAKDHARLLEVHVDRALSASYALAARWAAR